MSKHENEVKIPPSALTWRFSRSSGPGGQHVNTSDTRVELICDLTKLSAESEILEQIIARLGSELRVVVSSQRSQNRNRKVALEKLTDQLERAAKIPRRRRATKPTWSSTQNRLNKKRKASIRKTERRNQQDD